MIGQPSPAASKRPGLGVIIVLTVLALAILSRESVTMEGPASWLFSDVAGGFRLSDLLLLTVTYAAGLKALVRWRTESPQVSVGYLMPGVLFAVALFIAILIGASAGGQHLFFDWRNLLLGLGYLWFVVQVASTRARWEQLVVGFFVLSGTYGLYLLVPFLFGIGLHLYYGYVPVFNGPSIGLFVQTFSLAVALQLSGLRKWPLAAVSALSFVMVLISLRRTYWAELLIVAALLVLSAHLRYRWSLSWFLAVAAVGLMTLDPPWLSHYLLRFRSLNPFDFGNPLGTTNEDHVNDLRDAWRVIRDNPLWGYGLGRPYLTHYSSGWKEESWGVHNSLLHVWVRYGLGGLIAYLWFHLKFVWDSRRLYQGLHDPWLRGMVLGMLVYVAAVFIVSSAFSPWPYGSFELSVQIFFGIGCLAAAARLGHKAPTGGG